MKNVKSVYKISKWALFSSKGGSPAPLLAQCVKVLFAHEVCERFLLLCYHWC